MRKLPNFKEHNCYCEQKIAYNFLFTHAHINGKSLEKIIHSIDSNYTNDKKFKRYDVEAVKTCITKNYDKYLQKPFIAGSYKEIAEKLPL